MFNLCFCFLMGHFFFCFLNANCCFQVINLRWHTNCFDFCFFRFWKSDQQFIQFSLKVALIKIREWVKSFAIFWKVKHNLAIPIAFAKVMTERSRLMISECYSLDLSAYLTFPGYSTVINCAFTFITTNVFWLILKH